MNDIQFFIKLVACLVTNLLTVNKFIFVIMFMLCIVILSELT